MGKKDLEYLLRHNKPALNFANLDTVWEELPEPKMLVW
jgi:hypothetical protein